ncbi:MAG: YtxH domain-containing protein [Candidatus Gastranaerophilales bacterium]|nr:YtxH domain-containing protein [Candidatus Gastranaerophilales bacterium]
MSITRFFAGVTIGAAIGAIAGVLLAPQSGEETREALGSMAKDVAKKTDRTVKDIQDKADSIVSDMQEKGDEIIEKIQDLINRQKDEAFNNN